MPILGYQCRTDFPKIVHARSVCSPYLFIRQFSMIYYKIEGHRTDFSHKVFPPAANYTNNQLDHSWINPLDIFPLQWRQNGHDGVSNHQPQQYLLNRYSGADQRNIKARRHWTYGGEFTGDCDKCNHWNSIYRYKQWVSIYIWTLWHFKIYWYIWATVYAIYLIRPPDHSEIDSLWPNWCLLGHLQAHFGKWNF